MNYKSSSLEWVTSTLLSTSPGITHGMTTRAGGVSPSPYGTLNIGLHVGDSPHLVLENRQRVCQDLGFTLDDWVSGEQVHKAEVARVTPLDRGKGAVHLDTAIPNVDGLITDAPGILLAAFFADCVPLFVVDPRGPRVGLGHAGWRGTVARMAEMLVRRMEDAFGTDPTALLVWIGPSIGPCCFAVASDVADIFNAAFGDVVIQGRGEQAFLDLPRLNQQLFIASGVSEERIEVSTACTMCDTSKFFSHRALGPKTGRMAGLLGIHSQ